ncbi:hypothetical protein HOLleu_19990 [Holothuria leucospilota]|uniref:Uncharacterized protein n=1 Tax=Holothuria leucospilota TaxID=206669 RepID=A0A9Q1H5D6_HOLLE|nr:hypothetical protein HOLleu_19990 [Holothuria leucospilota]
MTRTSELYSLYATFGVRVKMSQDACIGSTFCMPKDRLRRPCLLYYLYCAGACVSLKWISANSPLMKACVMETLNDSHLTLKLVSAYLSVMVVVEAMKTTLLHY